VGRACWFRSSGSRALVLGKGKLKVFPKLASGISFCIDFLDMHELKHSAHSCPGWSIRCGVVGW
jgi:hypothetical protein